MERKAAKLLLQRPVEISSRKICEAEENAIEKDCFPQPCVGPSKNGAVKGLAYESQAEYAFPSPPATGEQGLFLPAYATQRIFKVKTCFLCLVRIT